MSQTIAQPIDEVFATTGRLDEHGPSQNDRHRRRWKTRRARVRPTRGFHRSELEMVGSELTMRQAAEVLARVLGRPVKFRRLPMPIARVALDKEFFQVFHWINDSGYQADFKGLRARYPELQLRTLEDWLGEEGWEGKRELTVRRDKLGCPLTPT